MTTMVLAHTNGNGHGAATPDGTAWLRQSVQQRFSQFNWDDTPPEIQELRQTTTQPGQQILSLTLTVNQFFNAINWQGSSIAAPPQSDAPAQSNAMNDAFTLEDFSDLF